MPTRVRGADIVVRTLEIAGCSSIFTLSGNHIMPIFDAALGSRLRLLHVRHEAAAVHMADAWGRLTGHCGVALVSGGAGHANAVAALSTAEPAQSPVLLLSGHAGLAEIGRGAFQEMRQADLAAPLSKASWVAGSTAALGHDIARAIRTSLSGSPGPVHVSLPFDLLEAEVEETPDLYPAAADFMAVPQLLESETADRALAVLAEARRPLILGGPTLCRGDAPALLHRLAAATGVPAIGMESPRGINDPSLGAFAEALRRADLLMLIGKPLDFTLRFGDAPFVDPDCRFAIIDPDAALIERATRQKRERMAFGAVADAVAAAEALIARLPQRAAEESAWQREVAEAIAYRPESWARLASASAAKVHPIELCRAVARHIDGDAGAVLVCDGGEIGQWPQAVVKPPRRIINGVAGSIGASIPFAIAARAAAPGASVIAVMGDGSFGFHMAEIDTAVRCGLPFIAVVGNDATWNAEHQIQLRTYGSARTHGCDLLPSRYHLVATALGGHGELVTEAAQLGPALARARASGKPACVNVMIERVAAPTFRRSA